MPYVYSTATAGIDYVEYKPSPDKAASNELIRKVSIKGGANLADLKNALVTPYGVATHVSDEELAFLERNEAFNRHRAAGFMYVDKKKVEDIAKLVEEKGMQPKDKSAPLTPESKEVAGKTVVTSPPQKPDKKG